MRADYGLESMIPGELLNPGARTRALWSAGSLCIALTFSPAILAEGFCDSELLAFGSPHTSYQMRDNRCEGAHKLKVSSSSKLAIVSFTESFDYEMERAEPLFIRWDEPGDGGRLRVRSRNVGVLKRGVYYRMDSEVAAADRAFRWPSNILAALRLRRSTLGALAWTRKQVSGFGEENVYLPLRISQGDGSPKPSAAQHYQLALLPSERLESVSFSLRAHGAPKPIVDRHDLDLGFYPGGQATLVRIPKPEKQGLYRVEILAGLYRDPQITVSSSLWFLQSTAEEASVR